MKTTEKKLIAVVGPTAVGKTKLAIQLAKTFGTEIISADSRQFFRELTIGTAKPSAAELGEVKHHFINSHSINTDYDAAEYGIDALAVINELFTIHDHVILCGGSGLYVRAVCEGFDPIPDVPATIREELVRQYNASGIEWLQRKMQELDPEHFATIDRQNPHRLIRALEIKIGTGKSISTFRTNLKSKHPFAIVKIGLDLPREQLYAKIDQRMDEMIAHGLFQEASDLYPFKHKNALQTVGYQEIFDYLDGKFDYTEAVRLLKRNSRNYAKRQLTWFRRDEEIRWFGPDELESILAFIQLPQKNLGGGEPEF